MDQRKITHRISLILSQSNRSMKPWTPRTIVVLTFFLVFIAMGLWNEVYAEAEKAKIYAATNDNKLWVREGGAPNIPWQQIGHAYHVVGLAASGSKLYAATNKNELWVRDAVEDDIAWRYIGHAFNVVAMTAFESKLYAATRDNKLWVRDTIEEDVPWEPIGHAYHVVAMTSWEGKLYAATKSNSLWVRDTAGVDVPWKHIGHAYNVTGLSALDGKLYAATSENELWVRDISEREIAWNGIGHAYHIVAMTGLAKQISVGNDDREQSVVAGIGNNSISESLSTGTGSTAAEIWDREYDPEFTNCPGANVDPMESEQTCCQEIPVNTTNTLFDVLLRFEKPQIYDPTKTVILGDHYPSEYTSHIWGIVNGAQAEDHYVENYVTTDIDYQICIQDGNGFPVCTAPINQFDVFFSEIYSSAYTGPVSGSIGDLPDSMEYSELVVHVFTITDRAYFLEESPVDDNGNWSVNRGNRGQKMVEVYRKTDTRWLSSLARGYREIGGVNQFVFPKSNRGFKSVRLIHKPDGQIVAEDYETPKLLRSYHLNQDDSAWKALKDRTFLYDQALAIIAAVNLHDQTSAELWVEGMLDVQESDGQFPFSVNRKSGVIPEIKFRTGSQFWNVYSLLWFLKHYPETDLSEIIVARIRNCLDTLISLYRVEEEGLQQFAFRGGPDVTWCSTEHNIDAAFALLLAGEVLSDSAYTTIGEQVLDALRTNFWDDGNERAYQGIISQTEVDPNHALDVGSWYSILMRTLANDTDRADKALISTEPYIVVDGEFDARGYTPYLQEFGYPDAKGGFWGEGTAGVILALAAAQEDTCTLKAWFNELLKVGTDEGILYITIPDPENGLLSAPALSSTAWAIITGKPNDFWNVKDNLLDNE